MINRLKHHFTMLATISMFILMTLLLLIMNVVNYSSVVSESDEILDVLSQPDAPFLDGGFLGIPFDDFIPYGMSVEVPYESRYFTATILPNGELLKVDFSRIVSVDINSSIEYIEQAINSRKTRGFIGRFRYLKSNDGLMMRIIFLDCGRKLDAYNKFLWISIAVGAIGCLIVYIVFKLASGKIIKPIAESYQKQKRFISDAGHELKTPLTIINANVDLLQSDMEKEELDEIKQQTTRLSELTNNLVMLSKMDEEQQTITKIEMPLSDIVNETTGSFMAVAQSHGNTLNMDVQPQISFVGEIESIRQLVSILLENAVKYSIKDTDISIKLATQKKTAVLTVTNTTANSVSEEDLQHIFDRFYRTDTSRNSELGGHGIGLSIAQAIVVRHKGNIKAGMNNGNNFHITVSLPL